MISTEVVDISSIEQLNNIPSSLVSTNVIQHDILLDKLLSRDNHLLSEKEDTNNSIEETGEVDEKVNNIEDDSSNNNNIIVENRDNEAINRDMVNGDKAIETNDHYITRSTRISRLCDFKKYFSETAYVQIEEEKGRYLKSYYFDNGGMIEKLASGIYYQESYFSDRVSIKELAVEVFDIPIIEWNDID